MTVTDTPIRTPITPDERPAASSNLPAALSVSGVSHSYGNRRALDNVSFSIPPATFLALLGLNGAGKSTLVSLITRLFGVQAGSIEIFNHDIRQHPSQALRMLGVVFQPRTLDLDLSVAQNLVYHAALHGIGKRDALARADDLLHRLGLADRSKDKVRVLSGGQMRRLEIARALLHRPRLLLLDEPTVGLDVKARFDILTYVRRLVSEDRISVLWATHLFDEVTPDDDLVVLHHGKMRAHDVASQVIKEAGAPNLHSAFVRLTGAAVDTVSTAP